MSDESLQRNPNHTTNPLEALVQAGVGGHQALVLSAFIDERKKWEEKKQALQKEFTKKMNIHKLCLEFKEKEPGWKKFLYKKLLRRNSPAERKAEEAIKSLDDIAGRLLAHDDAEPDATLYELGALGNSLFKPR